MVYELRLDCHLSMLLPPGSRLLNLPGHRRGTQGNKRQAPKRPCSRPYVERQSSGYVSCIAAGADGYCLKDTQAKELLLAIHTVSTGATWLDPPIAQYVRRAVTTQASAPSSTTNRPSPFALSHREADILLLLVEGLSNGEMAERLIVSTETVKTHMRHIMEKLQVNDRTQADRKAMQDGSV